VIVAAIVLTAIAAALFVVRILVGSTLADRVVALDGFVVTLVALIVLVSIERDDGIYLDVAIVVAFIGFVGTTAAARFIERRGG
jgi:multisubunit Na+/H+ antiporter MnhF subunit